MAGRARSAKRRTKRRSPPKEQGKAIALYHDMRVEEDFERCAQRLFEILQYAARKLPDQRRILFLDIQGHRNELGAFDHDAWEILRYFVLEYLFPYLSEVYTPLIGVKNSKPQRNDVPEQLVIYPPPDGSTEYNVHALMPRCRESHPAFRKSPPSVKAIADYLGMSEPCCLICWQTPVERAHALPKSLGGSYDVRNYALLCPRHHKLAPDVSDAEAFWAWIDYVSIRDNHEKWPSSPGLGQLDVCLPEDGPAKDRADFNYTVRRELVELYGWQDQDFADMGWNLQSEFHRVMADATGEHFAVRRKPSTYAWAYDTARKRLRASLPAEPVD
jgi:hypothetical protein